MGLFFCMVAAIDGFKMDDPYPGYGKISRKHEEIIREYTDEKANIVDDLTYTRDRALDYIRDARQNLAARRSELPPVTQPPQLKPAMARAMAPTTAP